MKYRKKPVVIEAMKWTGYNGNDVIQWAKKASPNLKTPVFRFVQDAENENLYALYIMTLEGEMLADVGDMIICGVNGEFYPCKPDIFEKTYEPAEDENGM